MDWFAMIPILDKDTIRYITANATPEEAEYIDGVKTIITDASKLSNLTEDAPDDILYVTKIMAFTEKFQTLHWAANTMSYHKVIDEFLDELSEYKDAIAENIQAVIGQFDASQFTKLELPIGDDPLEIINELKDCVYNWFVYHQDDPQYEGCRNITSGLIETIYKYIYLFRLCKNGN